MSIIGEMYEEDIEKMEKTHRAELARKDELLDAYREKVVLLEKLIEVKDDRIKNFENYVEELKKHIDKSHEQFDSIMAVANKLLK